MKKPQNKQRASTLAALLQDTPKRGRPPLAVSRQNVYVSLSDAQKAEMAELGKQLPKALKRSDVPDVAIAVLNVRLEALRQAVAGRNREIPEGITDLESLYLLWDLPLPEKDVELKWTSLRVSPQESIELGRAHGTLNAAFSANRSETFSLALSLLHQFLDQYSQEVASLSLHDLRQKIVNLFMSN